MLVHNEDKTLEKLLKFLVKWKHMDDEIVILDDYSDNEKTKQIVNKYRTWWDKDKRTWKEGFKGHGHS